ncbi:hypothetical protein KBZ18_12810 [Synechococcus sp. Cruz-9H2]|uniref:hypothetical protein n=1 Tax=unclassified Synechococcus TaxID=2626047 RepID=UPI0020CD3588|nr:MULTISPECIES: hypothetical protein [unclassified Synechococcus]MCP9820365.1 hypothetical protein [Synechococcus sp. Cruz-9H2]MCP9844673.1 hypothetical protein [Synechococcus sp. Edmonson 11F2]MCP9856795.1 hypothetical protein [Synechococcus sp. Cruz-9C9]MCP9863995.1 hypothetical protein [Synechococcus sp. Cruz-7E5]MCP9871190.1 hypothetical protein [Synechococcus sp. Cruz-7B9]
MIDLIQWVKAMSRRPIQTHLQDGFQPDYPAVQVIDAALLFIHQAGHFLHLVVHPYHGGELQLLQGRFQAVVLGQLVAGAGGIGGSSLSEKLPQREPHAAGAIGERGFFCGRHQHRYTLCGALITAL